MSIVVIVTLDCHKPSTNKLCFFRDNLYKGGYGAGIKGFKTEERAFSLYFSIRNLRWLFLNN